MNTNTDFTIDMKQCPTNPFIDIYNDKDELVITTNEELTYQWVLAEIAEKHIFGWYLIKHGDPTKYYITPKGDVAVTLFKESGAQQLRRWHAAQDHYSEIINMDHCPNNERITIYDCNNDIICITDSDLELQWVLNEIRDRHLTGCYIIYRNYRYLIDEFGHIDETDKPVLFKEYAAQVQRFKQN